MSVIVEHIRIYAFYTYMYIFSSERTTQRASWSLTMKVNIIASESARSFGDSLRDFDARGLIRGNFVLIESGVVSNIKLLPLIKKHW